MSFNFESIRNIAVVGHSGEGKTTLVEAMLYNAGAIDRMGKVADGTTVSDFDDLEKAKNMSTPSLYLSTFYFMIKNIFQMLTKMLLSK